jgi:hypothetical protein
LKSGKNGFRKDSQPERKIAIWLHIASIYEQFTTDKPLSFAKRRDIFRVLVNCSISSKDTVFEVLQLEALSKREAEVVVDAYFRK